MANPSRDFIPALCGTRYKSKLWANSTYKQTQYLQILESVFKGGQEDPFFLLPVFGMCFQWQECQPSFGPELVLKMEVHIVKQ